MQYRVKHLLLNVNFMDTAEMIQAILNTNNEIYIEKKRKIPDEC